MQGYDYNFYFLCVFTTHMKVQKSSPISKVRRLQFKMMMMHLTQIMWPRSIKLCMFQTQVSLFIYTYSLALATPLVASA